MKLPSRNPSAEHIFGLESHEVIGRVLGGILRQQALELAGPWGDNGNLDRPLQGKVLHRSGETHLVEFLLAAGELDERGEPYRLLIANDITHQWLREEQLQRAVKLQTVINTILHAATLDRPFPEQLRIILDLILAISTLKILPMGGILVADKNARSLRLLVHTGLRPEHVATCAEVKVGSCYCGRAAGEERMTHADTYCPTRDTDAPCRRLYPGASHYSIPIRSEERVLGVLVLFLERPLSGPHPAMETMLAVTNVLAAVMEREEMRREQDELICHLRAANRSLRAEKRFSESIIASLRHGLLILNSEGRVEACNPVGHRLLKRFFPGEPGGGSWARLSGRSWPRACSPRLCRFPPRRPTGERLP